MSLEKGFAHEQLARDYLVQQGLRFVTNNYRCRFGEIDLIFWDKTILSFVEVRSRVSNDYGGALESITQQKRKKIIKTASHYMISKKLYDTTCARFDVILLQGATAELEWIKNAFDASY